MHKKFIIFGKDENANRIQILEHIQQITENLDQRLNNHSNRIYDLEQTIILLRELICNGKHEWIKTKVLGRQSVSIKYMTYTCKKCGKEATCEEILHDKKSIPPKKGEEKTIYRA